MSVSARLDPLSVTVDPGGQAVVALHVSNTGTTVESYGFEVVGGAAGWAVVEPPTMSLLPGTGDVVTVRLQPPRSPDVLAGEAPYGVRVVPTDQPASTVVPEGVAVVTPFQELGTELLPRASHGWRRGRHKLTVENRGNAPVEVELGGQVGSGRARLNLAATQLLVQPGEARFVDVVVRPAVRRWRGSPVTHPFQVTSVLVGTHTDTPHTVDGTYEQDVLLPRWVPRAVLAAAALAAALAGLWYGLLRPAVRSTAKEAANTQAVKVVQQGAVKPAPGGGNSPAPVPGGAVPGAPGGGTAPAPGGGSAPGGGAPGGGGATAAPAPAGGGGDAAGTPTSVRLTVEDGVGGNSATTNPGFVVPRNQEFDLTDLVVQNPQGDAGSLVISSQGRTILTFLLENFRDYDYHWVSPILVPSTGRVTMTVTCRQVGRPVAAPAPTSCSESVLLGGRLRKTAPASTAPH